MCFPGWRGFQSFLVGKLFKVICSGRDDDQGAKYRPGKKFDTHVNTVTSPNDAFTALYIDKKAPSKE